MDVYKVKIPEKMSSNKGAFLFDRPDGVKVKVKLTSKQKDLWQRWVDGKIYSEAEYGDVLADENNSHLKILSDDTGRVGIYWIGDIENNDNVEVGWNSRNYFYDDSFATWRKIRDAKEITPERRGLEYDGATASVINFQDPPSAISPLLSMQDLQKTPVVPDYDTFYKDIPNHLRPSRKDYITLYGLRNDPASEEEIVDYDTFYKDIPNHLRPSRNDYMTLYGISKGGKGRSKKRRKKFTKRRSITKRRRYKSNRRSVKRRRIKRRRSKRRRSKRR